MFFGRVAEHDSPTRLLNAVNALVTSTIKDVFLAVLYHIPSILCIAQREKNEMNDIGKK
jgi:hypothetical protein